MTDNDAPCKSPFSHYSGNCSVFSEENEERCRLYLWREISWWTQWAGRQMGRERGGAETSRQKHTNTRAIVYFYTTYRACGIYSRILINNLLNKCSSHQESALHTIREINKSAFQQDWEAPSPAERQILACVSVGHTKTQNWVCTQSSLISCLQVQFLCTAPLSPLYDFCILNMFYNLQLEIMNEYAKKSFEFI